MEPPQLRLGLLGYRPKKVRLLLADRDAMFVRVADEARSLEQQVKELEAELNEARGDTAICSRELAAAEQRERVLVSGSEYANGRLATLERDLGDARATIATQRDLAQERSLELADARRRVRQMEDELGTTRRELEELERDDGSAAPASSEQLSAVLEATERAFAQIIEGARQRGEEQLRSSEETRERLGREIADLMAWRDRIQPIIASIQGSVHEATAQVAQVGDRIQSVLGPVTESMDALASSLSELRGVADAPSADAGREAGDASGGTGDDPPTVNVPEMEPASEPTSTEAGSADATGEPDRTQDKPWRDPGGYVGSGRMWTDPR